MVWCNLRSIGHFVCDTCWITSSMGKPCIDSRLKGTKIHVPDQILRRTQSVRTRFASQSVDNAHHEYLGYRCKQYRSQTRKRENHGELVKKGVDKAVATLSMVSSFLRVLAREENTTTDFIIDSDKSRQEAERRLNRCRREITDVLRTVL